MPVPAPWEAAVESSQSIDQVLGVSSPGSLCVAASAKLPLTVAVEAALTPIAGAAFWTVSVMTSELHRSIVTAVAVVDGLRRAGVPARVTAVAPVL